MKLTSNYLVNRFVRKLCVQESLGRQVTFPVTLTAGAVNNTLDNHGEIVMAAEVERRTELALDAIKQTFGTEVGEDSVQLFVEHHLEELPKSYWQQYLGSHTPEPGAVLGLLQLRSSWGDNDLEHLDFTLPGEVTDYVVSVHFDSSGKIDGISMES